jgi:hypothetical protein
MQQALCLQGVADALQVSGGPERQQLLQVGAAYVQPGQAAGARGRKMLVERLDLLRQNRLLEPDSGGEGGGKSQL